MNPAPVETAMPRHRTIDNSRYLYLVLASLTTGERFTQPRTPAFADHNLVHGPSTTIRYDYFISLDWGTSNEEEEILKHFFVDFK